MRRNDLENAGTIRSNALWGKSGRGDARSNALWGKSGRRAGIALAALLLFSIPLAASAGTRSMHGDETGASYVTPGLKAFAKGHPAKTIRVIVQSSKGLSSAEKAFGGLGSLHKRLRLVDGVAVAIPASRLAQLSRIPGLTITPDAPVKVSGGINYSTQLWPYVAGFAPLWNAVPRVGYSQTRAPAPAIAIIDSGIQADRADFGNRIAANVNLATLPNNSAGDGRGHGTFVAGIAAGSGAGYAGGAPNAKIVSLDVMDDTGMARTSDVIAACQWILANKDTYNIRVANFSLHSSTPSNFTRDPLDHAVEKLWFSGVTVVAAAGNYGSADGPSRVRYAPGNDPFAITVGATDINNTLMKTDDTAAPWSAWGYTYDGFAKPELGAPGRYMVGPIPAGSTLAAEKAANVTSPGYIQLSGTSFSAPAVAGAAAQILAWHPNFTPDQVKGALMLSAQPTAAATPGSLGVGELDATRAVLVARPPNPNAGLEQYLMPDPTGGATPVVDANGWVGAATASVSWDSISWNDVSWGSAAWSAVAWSDVAWSDISWLDVSSSDVAWSDVGWSDIAWEDAAEGEANLAGGYTLSPAEAAALASDPSAGGLPGRASSGPRPQP